MHKCFYITRSVIYMVWVQTEHILYKTMWIQIEHYFSRSRIQIEHKNPKFKCTEGLNYNVSHNANSGKIWSQNFKSQYTKWFLLRKTENVNINRKSRLFLSKKRRNMDKSAVRADPPCFRHRLDEFVHAQISWRIFLLSGCTVLPVIVQTFYSLFVIFPCRLLDFAIWEWTSRFLSSG